MYLSNTNTLQSRPVLGRGIARGGTSSDATINWTFTESGADGNLVISGGASINATTSSTGTFTASPGTIVSSSLVGVNWPGGTSLTSMSLFINGTDYSFAGSSSVSSSKVMAQFTASANQNYTIEGFVNSYTPPSPPSPPGTGLYAYGFAKGGSGGSTFSYVDNTNTSQSFSLAQEVTSSVDAPFIFNTVIGIGTTSGPTFAQTWSSPFTSSFTTGSSSSCKTTTFTNPQPNLPGQNFFLAAYIPCNSTTYAFRIVKPAQSYQDCASYLNIAYMSPGGTYNLEQSNITTGSAC
jgi:hypothetical protein